MLATAMSNYWVTWFPGVLLALFGVMALVWKGIKTFVKVQEALPVLFSIQSQFSPNGGNSMRDQVNTLNVKVAGIDKKLLRQERQLDRHDAALERIEDKMKP